MNDVAGPSLDISGDTPPNAPRQDVVDRGGWGCLRTAGALVAILVGLAALVFVWFYISIAQQFRAPEAVPAPVAWASREVVLSPDHSVVRGRLTLTARDTPEADLRVGLNAGVPAAEALATATGSGVIGPQETTAPADLLTAPRVRLTAVTGSGAARSCLAPCELVLSSGLDCVSGTCRVDFAVTVELTPDPSGTRNTVRVDVAGGATAPLGERLPDGLVVDLPLSDGS
jgi:hypothetical protein